MLRCIELGGALVYSFDSGDLVDIVPWMERYTSRGGREVDLGDASLYWLAIVTGCVSIMTTDVTDLSRYRLPNRKRFEIL